VLLFFSCDGSDNNYDAPCYPILPIESSGQPCIRMIRSAAMCQREGYPKERQQINDVTAVIDASNIYGSSRKASESLRNTTSKFSLRSHRDGSYSNSSGSACSHGTELITRRKVLRLNRTNCRPGSIYVRVRRWSQSVSNPILYRTKWS
jgi:hypothetical protein